MANISSAIGTIEFSSSNKELIKILYDSLAEMKGAYLTELEDEFNINKIVKTGNNYSLTTSFYAVGRWTYLNNISYYPFWIDLSENERKKMYQNDWTITYDFVDEESGCCVLYQANVEVIHDKNTEVKQLKTYEEVTDYEYSWINMVKLGFYDSISDYVENNYFIDDKDSAEWFMDEFDANKGNIAEYYGCNSKNIHEILNISGLNEIYDTALKLLEQ